MKYFIKSTLFVLSVAFVLASCEGQYDSLVDERLDENQPPENSVTAKSGDADFSNYVAIGNSLTAGFMDGALYNLGQQNSIPALMADKFELAGGSEFNQPDIDSELGFNKSATTQSGPTLGRFKLFTDTDNPAPSPTLNGEKPAPYKGDRSALDNFGVPGATVGQLLSPATGSQQGNPYYARFASTPSQSTVLGDAIATQPTFFTLWIGNNDVLGYAMSGASNPAVLTSNPDFKTRFNDVINKLMGKTNAKGVVINIPPFLGLPYFRAVTYKSVPKNKAIADQLNASYQQYNAGLNQAESMGAITPKEAARRQISFTSDDSTFVIKDEYLTAVPGLPKIRQSEPTDLFTLPLGSVLGKNLGNGKYGLADPVADKYVLLPKEQQKIDMRRNAFNTDIKNAVNSNSNRLALYDTNNPSGAFFDLFGISDGSPGITVDGVALKADFSPNGVISTDGIHPNPRGNAILANEIIKVIEDSFGATLPRIDVLNLPSVQTCDDDCVSEQGGGS